MKINLYKSKIKDFFKYRQDWIKTFKAIEIWNFIEFVFPEFKETNCFFNCENTLYLPVWKLKEQAKIKGLDNLLKEWINENIHRAYQSWDKRQFQEVLHFVVLEGATEYERVSLETYLLDWLWERYCSEIWSFNQDETQEILDILNGNEDK